VRTLARRTAPHRRSRAPTHQRDVAAKSAGVPIKVVSERIGHADPAVTTEVYAHALEGDDATAGTTVTAIFGDP